MRHEREKLTLERAFAIVLRERRMALGLHQKDLEADDGTMDRSYISRLEHGRRQVCLRGIFHLADVLGMSTGELMDAVADRMKR